MSEIIDLINNRGGKTVSERIRERHPYIFENLEKEGAYVFGAAMLGEFAAAQLKKERIPFKGFVANHGSDSMDMLFAPASLKRNDIVIIASFYVSDISEQLDSLNIANYIYYEELALADCGFDVYYQAFDKVYEDLITEQDKFDYIYGLLNDEPSKAIFRYLIEYRLSMDIQYTRKAYEISAEYGKQDLDNAVLELISPEYTFFDVGGFDGQSTVDFIDAVQNYKAIYFFEPDHDILISSMKRLQRYDNINYVEAGVGAKSDGTAKYSALGKGGGMVSDDGEQIIKIVSLDDYRNIGKAYIKMDIEGAEAEALEGAKEMIKLSHPILSVSVYHRPSDMYKLILQVLSYYPKYRLIIRHYSKTYADTRCYFLPVAEM